MTYPHDIRQQIIDYIAAHGREDTPTMLLYHAAQALDFPEGCTPADARMLMQANHKLAQDAHDLCLALSEMLDEDDGGMSAGPARSVLNRVLAERPAINGESANEGSAS